ncbi:unnamed protein product [Nyctereutes procyonoides]|uniref:Translationally-controlled tumor protein n=1 Tax=Nyctereutes procyonoides TaxID=34880 RepID=A0A811ZXP4_NYCPR|nr:unnamed protein product [Nyctereutes procyonoides]
MIIYWDLISQGEMLSYIYKIQDIMDKLCLEVEEMVVSRTEGNTDNSFIFGDASTEIPKGEGMKSTVITCVDIYYMKSIKGKHRPESIMMGAAEQIMHILANFKNYRFFIGENMNPDGMVALLDYCEESVTPYMIFFKDDLKMEKS